LEYQDCGDLGITFGPGFMLILHEALITGRYPRQSLMQNYSPDNAALVDLSIAAQQRGKLEISIFKIDILFAACGREGGRAKQRPVSRLCERH